METGTAARVVRRGAGIVACALLLLGAGTLPGSREIPIAQLAPTVASTGAVHRGPGSFGVDVDGWTALYLPLPGTEVLEVDYRAKGLLLLSWTSATETGTDWPRLPPWHHERVEPGTGRLTLDLRTTRNWSPARTPFLLLEGNGTFDVTGVRVRVAPRATEAWRRSMDEAGLWGPLRIGSTSINDLDPAMWSLSEGTTLASRIGLVFAGASVAGALLLAGLRRRWRPAPIVAIVAVAGALAGDVVLAWRAAPVLALRPTSGPGERLRRNLVLAPEVGALAALAREQLGPGERVGVQSPPGDWFNWETLCYHLAPRPCVHVVPGQESFEGLQGTHRLSLDQLDVVAYFHADGPLLPGFKRGARVGPSAYLARRR